MEVTAVLVGFAQVIVVLVGFISIFLTFLLRDNDPDPVMQMHARALIMVAPGVLIYALVPLVLAAFGLGIERAMQWMAGIGLLPFLVGSGLNFRSFFALSFNEKRRTGYYHMVLAGLIKAGVLACTLLILAGVAIVGNYFAILLAGTFGAVLALFTFFIDELRLFRADKMSAKETKEEVD